MKRNPTHGHANRASALIRGVLWRDSSTGSEDPLKHLDRDGLEALFDALTPVLSTEERTQVRRMLERA
ncbi:MAG: hypothetical protein AAF645_27845 [Myxococcota bacterium]